MNSVAPNVNTYLGKFANGFLIDRDREFFLGIFLKEGLDHTKGTNDIMKQGKLSITSLSSIDKLSYDEAYSNY